MAQVYHKSFSPHPADAEGLHSIYCDGLSPNSLLCDTHWHNRFELILVISGDFRFRLNLQELIIKEGQIAIIPPKALHYGLVGPAGCSSITLMFDLEILCNQFTTIKEYVDNILKQKIFFSPSTEHPEVISTFKAIVEGFSVHDMSAQFSQLGNVYALLALLQKYCASNKPSNYSTAEKFKHIFEYINENFTQKISAEDLSKRFGYNRSYLCRQFKMMTGLSPMTYIKNLRLEKATEILHKEHISIEELASRCGFEDANYFARCFKKEYNIPPSKYAQLFKK